MKKKSSFSNSSESLFFSASENDLLATAPLSARMRPRTLGELVGQRHILGEGKLLTRAIEADRLSSLILYGPPGVGKTTLAQCVGVATKAHFEFINAVVSNVEELRKILVASKHRRLTSTPTNSFLCVDSSIRNEEINTQKQNCRGTSQRKTILFIDEIHRFNKAQQDVLMPDLEEGNVILIGATVFNPFFSLTSPLLSRSLIFELQPLSAEEILMILERALKDKEWGLGNMNLCVEEKAVKFLAEICDGDARKALNAFEVGALTTSPDEKGQIHFTLEVAQESIQKKQVRYDQQGDGHYDTASAFIKSMRGSDPDATLYWLAKMLYAGEDPRFIARRICICAAEDVGNADPRALVLANAALQVSEFIGLPEARIPLAQAAVYIACAPKSNAAYMGLEKASKDVQEGRTQEVPNHLKGTGYSGAKRLGHGQDYKYAHDYKGHFVEQEYMAQKKAYYEPTEQGHEKEMAEYLKNVRKKF